MSQHPYKSIVAKLLLVLVVSLLSLSFATLAEAKEPTSTQKMGLDEQVQDIKSHVLTLAKELDQLEQKLLYPAHTQIAIFISMPKSEGFNLSSVDIELDGKSVSQHIYSPRELEAFEQGGVQRIYTGNIATGKHELKVTTRAKLETGKIVGMTKSFQIEKTVEAAIAELVLSRKSIILLDR